MRRALHRHVARLQLAHPHLRIPFVLSRSWQFCPSRGQLQPTKSGTRAIQRRLLHASGHTEQNGGEAATTSSANVDVEHAPTETLELSPITACPGCGALAQTVDAGRPGYYTMIRRKVQHFVKAHQNSNRQVPQMLEDTAAEGDAKPRATQVIEHQQDLSASVPICDRCHDLTHHNARVPIPNPTIEAIYDTIDCTPWKYNHIIHVIDAADFPLSALPKIHGLLDASPQRSRNRRAKAQRFTHNRVVDLSFVITRSDLLGPKKEMVDSLMPVLRRILEKHIGLDGKRKRFGNIRCVSSTRAWWTPEVKAAIKARGGAVWLVGKENVGKSKLFEVIFPKGSFGNVAVSDAQQIIAGNQREHGVGTTPIDPTFIDQKGDMSADNFLDGANFLLPPARQEVPYPLMPTVSEMPGTTASPIRIPFGNGKGELIDLPGLARGHLEQLVEPANRSQLLMRKRISNPTRYTVKPGQSLLLGGGLVRLTPVHQDLVTVMTPFVTVDGHLTSNEKATQIQDGTGDIEVPNILTDIARQNIRSAGLFEISQDVTKDRTGPLTARSAIGLKADVLPFRIFATDIVIEGLGWVDISVQVRRKDFPIENLSQHRQDHVRPPMPAVEVSTPYGEHIAARETLNAGEYMGPRSKARKARPRPSMARARKSQ